MMPAMRANARFINDSVCQIKQKIMRLPKEKLVPMVEWAAAQFHGENELQRLTQHFGGEDKWHATSKQLIAWGKKNLHPKTYDALTRSADGVIAIHSMMTNKEPSLQLSIRDSKSCSEEATVGQKKHQAGIKGLDMGG